MRPTLFVFFVLAIVAQPVSANAAGTSGRDARPRPLKYCWELENRGFEVSDKECKPIEASRLPELKGSMPNYLCFAAGIIRKADRTIVLRLTTKVPPLQTPLILTEASDAPDKFGTIFPGIHRRTGQVRWYGVIVQIANQEHKQNGNPLYGVDHQTWDRSLEILVPLSTTFHIMGKPLLVGIVNYEDFFADPFGPPGATYRENVLIPYRPVQ